MGCTFDGSTKIITMTAGTTILDVRDIYSRWKDWVISTGSNFLQAISVVGGDPVDVSQGIYVTSYFFLENGWKVKPQEADHKLKVTNGVLVTSDGTDPFIQTTGDYNVLIQYSQPVKSETVDIGGGSAPSVSQIVAGVWSDSTAQSILTQLAVVKGLSKENFLMKDQVYDSDKRLLSATVRIFATAADCNNDVNPIEEYAVTSTYGTGATFKMVKL